MPIEFSVSLAYDDIYQDYATVDPEALVRDIPTKMALALVCHYTAQLHTLEKDAQKQLEIINDWSRRFPNAVKTKIAQKIREFTQKGLSNFNFFNNISSLYLIEFLLENSNALPKVKDLTPQQEENLFKAYIYFSAKWTKEQEAFLNANKNTSIIDWTLSLMLPFSEIVEFKDFRLQFIKGVYFFKFCEQNELFNSYLQTFLTQRGVTTWQEYLTNVLSVYMACLQEGSTRTVIKFSAGDQNILQALENFCVDPTTFKKAQDFLTLREKPLLKYAPDEILILNLNFFIDKIYQSILFDVANSLISAGALYKGKPIARIIDFIGIYGNEFVEQGLFYKIMESAFRRKDYRHFNGDQLKDVIGNGAPDYIIIDKGKVYVFEFKNALFSAVAKYSYSNKEIKKEIEKKLVQNEGGKPKGVTQLVTFLNEVKGGRYAPIIGKDLNKLVIYPIIVTTDFSFNLPVINKLVNDEYENQVKGKGLTSAPFQINPLTLLDLDNIIKFQDLFISKRIALHYALRDYQKFLHRGTNDIDKAISFNKYIHIKTGTMKYGTPKMFYDEIEALLNIRGSISYNNQASAKNI